MFFTANAGWLDEFDLNPVFVRERGHGVAMADALLLTRGR